MKALYLSQLDDKFKLIFEKSFIEVVHPLCALPFKPILLAEKHKSISILDNILRPSIMCQL